jgi:hypothetical protein
MLSVALAALVALALIVLILVVLPAVALVRLLCLMSLPQDGPAIPNRGPLTAVRAAPRTHTDGRACA